MDLDKCGWAWWCLLMGCLRGVMHCVFIAVM